MASRGSRESERPVVACYREFEPRPALRGHVRALFSFVAGREIMAQPRRVLCEVRLAAGLGSTAPAPLLADGNASIAFDLGTFLGGDGLWRPNVAGACCRVIGPMTGVGPAERAELPAMLGAFLQPGHILSVARVSAGELTDRVLDVEDVWQGAEARDLAAELTLLDEATRLDRLESLLLQRIHDRHDHGLAANVPALARLVTQSRGRVSVESLANSAGVSRQRLTRVFRERVGVTPKLYARLARFQSSLVHARRGNGTDWARAAAELGYADQSHMIAEFRQFSSLTPERLATELWFHPFIERAKAAQSRDCASSTMMRES